MTIKINELRDNPGARQGRVRVGRGGMDKGEAEATAEAVTE